MENETVTLDGQDYDELMRLFFGFVEYTRATKSEKYKKKRMTLLKDVYAFSKQFGGCKNLTFKEFESTSVKVTQL